VIADRLPAARARRGGGVVCRRARSRAPTNPADASKDFGRRISLAIPCLCPAGLRRGVASGRQCSPPLVGALALLPCSASTLCAIVVRDELRINRPRRRRDHAPTRGRAHRRDRDGGRAHRGLESSSYLSRGHCSRRPVLEGAHHFRVSPRRRIARASVDVGGGTRRPTSVVRLARAYGIRPSPIRAAEHVCSRSAARVIACPPAAREPAPSLRPHGDGATAAPKPSVTDPAYTFCSRACAPAGSRSSQTW